MANIITTSDVTKTVTITSNNTTLGTVNQGSTSIVQVNSLGPQGLMGPQGIQGDKGNPGDLSSTTNLAITGSLFVSGANGNITASGNISASGNIIANKITASRLDVTDATITDILRVDSTQESYIAGDFSFKASQTGFRANTLGRGGVSIFPISDPNIDSNDFIIGTNNTANKFIFKQTGLLLVSGSGTRAGDVEATGNVTASGNISASGTGVHSFGGVVAAYNNIITEENFVFSGINTNIKVGAQRRLTLGATNDFVGNISASAIGAEGGNLEIKHITASGNISASAYYGDGSNLTGIDGNPFTHVTSSGNISASGDLISKDLYLDQYIYHNNDHNTYLNFTDDRLRFNIGGISYIDLNDATSAPHDITFNDGGNNVDLTIKGSSNNPLFKTDASHNRIGTHGKGTPEVAFHIGGDELRVDGNISASGAINTLSHITSSGNVSSSTTSTASFGLYLGDGSQLTGVASTVDSSSFAITGSDVLFANITASGRFKGDARDLFNTPQDLVWDGTMSDGYLQIITNNSYVNNPSATTQQFIPTSSLEFNHSTFNINDPVSEPIIYAKKATDTDTVSYPRLYDVMSTSGAYPIIFSGSNFAIHSIYQGMIDAGTVKVIDLDAIDSDNNGVITDISLLEAINNLLTTNINDAFNTTDLSYNLQDSYKRTGNTGQPQQLGISTLKSADPLSTKAFSYYYFTSESTRRGGGNSYDDIFVVSTNPNKVYTSLNTDLDTTFNSTVTVNSNITASGNISSSGFISAFGSSSLQGLPTSKPNTTGSLWLSGSAGQDSKFLVVFTG